MLRLWVLDPTKNGPKVRRYNGALDEQTLTWNNRVTPYVGTSVNSGALKAGSWAEWDVSGLVRRGRAMSPWRSCRKPATASTSPPGSRITGPNS